MQPKYSEETLRKVAHLLVEWDRRHFFPSPSQLEVFLQKEVRLLFQCLFVEQEPDPSDPSFAQVDAWLDQSRELDVHSVRLEILRRLSLISDAQAFSKFRSSEPIDFQYPDHAHVWQWRTYWKSIFKRSREIFDAIRSEDVLRAEELSWPYYEAMGLLTEIHSSDSRQAASAPPSVFDQSYADVAERLAQGLANLRDARILEVGCGEGRLLLAIRARLPEAKLVATNISGSKGMLKEVLEDSGIEIVEASAEMLPFPDSSFDAFVSTEVIEHLVRPGAMADEAFRVLRPGGALLITAPSVHTQFLNRNPMTYIVGLLSVYLPCLLPSFHNLYEPLTRLKLVHYAFSHHDFRRIFRPKFPDTRTYSFRFTHLKKFKLERLASRIPGLRGFGGVIAARGHKPM